MEGSGKRFLGNEAGKRKGYVMNESLMMGNMNGKIEDRDTGGNDKELRFFLLSSFLSTSVGILYSYLLIKLVHEVFFGEECMARKGSRGSSSCCPFLCFEENEILLYR